MSLANSEYFFYYGHCWCQPKRYRFLIFKLLLIVDHALMNKLIQYYREDLEIKENKVAMARTVSSGNRLSGKLAIDS